MAADCSELLGDIPDTKGTVLAKNLRGPAGPLPHGIPPWRWWYELREAIPGVSFFVFAVAGFGGMTSRRPLALGLFAVWLVLETGWFLRTYAPEVTLWLGSLFFPRDSTILHGLAPVVYLSGVTQLGVHPEDRTAGPTPWTTSLASAA